MAESTTTGSKPRNAPAIGSPHHVAPTKITQNPLFLAHLGKWLFWILQIAGFFRRRSHQAFGDRAHFDKFCFHSHDLLSERLAPGHSNWAVTAQHYAKWTGGDAYIEPDRLESGEVPADLLARFQVAAARATGEPEPADLASSGGASI